MTDKSAAAIREFAEKWGWFVKATSFDMTQFELNKDTEQFISDLTALISEHYVSKEEYDEEKKSNALLHKAMVTAEKGGHDKAMEEISEHYYPKEFVEWTMMQGIMGIYDRKGYLYSSALLNLKGFKGDNTIKNLFNYWKENERC